MSKRPFISLLMRLAYVAERLRKALPFHVTMGVHVLLVQAEEVVLVRNTYRTGLRLPGGGVKRGETLEEAARREAREEIGAEIGEMRLLGLYSRLSFCTSDHIAVFVATDFSMEALQSLEIESAALYPIDDLPADVVGSALRRIAEFKAGADSAVLAAW